MYLFVTSLMICELMIFIKVKCIVYPIFYNFLYILAINKIYWDFNNWPDNFNY